VATRCSKNKAAEIPRDTLPHTLRDNRDLLDEITRPDPLNLVENGADEIREVVETPVKAIATQRDGKLKIFAER